MFYRNILLRIILPGLMTLASMMAPVSLAQVSTSSPMPASNGAFEPYQSMLFGMGPAADQAVESEYVKKVPIRILSSWFNGANREETLGYMKSWRERRLLDEWWRKGYVLHVITYEPPGSDYHVSPQFLEDAAVLAEIYREEDDGKHLVLFSLATELQTYTSPPNRHESQTSAYYDRLQQQLLDARHIIKAEAPNARVSLDWGSWQVAWDNPANGEGLSMIDHFADTMRQMDFVSFQLMSELDVPNAEVVMLSLDVLRQYNPRLMMSHYKPDSRSQRVFDLDLPALLNEEFIRTARNKGLFAFSFMDDTLLGRSSAQQVYFDGVQRFTEWVN